VVPVPPEPYDTLPGRSFTQATISFRFFTGTSLLQ
jgi:hypothetical protein